MRRGWPRLAGQGRCRGRDRGCRKLLVVVHEYAAESAPADSDAAAERDLDLDYFDRILAWCATWSLLDLPHGSGRHAPALQPGAGRRRAARARVATRKAWPHGGGRRLDWMRRGGRARGGRGAKWGLTAQ